MAAAFDAIVLSKKNAEISRLKRLRAYAGYTQALHCDVRELLSTY